MSNFPTNLSPPVLESSRNKTVSSHFNQELETSANVLVPKHSFTYTVVDHRKKWLEDCPTRNQTLISAMRVQRSTDSASSLDRPV